MLNITPPNYKYCPFCGNELEIKIEESKKRKFCQNCNWAYYPHVNCAVGAVVIRDSKVLLVKRNREPYLGTWMFPAGFIEYGEHPLETLERELEEEVGLKLKNAKIVDILQTEDDPRAPGHFGIFYFAEVEGTIKNLDIEENQHVGWFGINNLPPIGWKSHKQIFKQYLTK